MTACAISLDLSRYLARLDREDAFDSACAAQVEAWRSDHNKVEEVLTGFEENGDSLALDHAVVLTAHPDDLPARALRFFLRLDDRVRAQLRADAPDAVRSASNDADDDDDRWAA